MGVQNTTLFALTDAELREMRGDRQLGTGLRGDEEADGLSAVSAVSPEPMVVDASGHGAQSRGQ